MLLLLLLSVFLRFSGQRQQQHKTPAAAVSSFPPQIAGSVAASACLCLCLLRLRHSRELRRVCVCVRCDNYTTVTRCAWRKKGSRRLSLYLFRHKRPPPTSPLCSVYFPCMLCTYVGRGDCWEKEHNNSNRQKGRAFGHIRSSPL